MTRTIKFRAWYGTNDSSILVSGMQPVGAYNLGPLLEDNVRPVMQFTGIEDMVGRDIYEGDILEYQGPTAYPRRVVEWTRSSQHVGWNIGMGHGGVRWTVVGNIYENPELIGKGV